ncbi:MAG: hypothetical protein ACK4KT_07965 [Thermaurantimonas sp.]
MKMITKNLLLFSFFMGLGAVIFRYLMSAFLSESAFESVWVLAAVYFLYNFLIGWYYGKKDYESLPLYDVGFRFHTATFFIFNFVSFLWFFSGAHSVYESVDQLYYMALFWGIGLAVHFILYMLARKKTIKGLNKEELFD